MEPAEGEADFSELLFTAGIDLPVRSRVEVITPVLEELDIGRLRQLRENSCTVELFVLGEQQQRARELWGREFSVFSVQDFSGELLYQ
jgi:hypothetical protein